MTLLSVCYLGATIAYPTLAVMIVVRNRRSALNWVCAGVLLCLALWSFTDIFHNEPRLPVERIRFFANLGSLGWCLFPSLLFSYSLVLTHRRRVLRNWLIYLPLVGLPVLFACLQWTGRLGVDYARQIFGWVTVWAPGGWPFAYYAYPLLSAAGASWVIADYRRHSTSARERRENLTLILTIVIPILLGAVTNIILPRLTTARFPELAPIFGLFWAGGLYYSATRYGLLTLSPRLATDEILSTMVDALLLLAPDSRIVNANRAAQELFGYHKSELVGRPGDILFALPGEFQDCAREVASGRAVRRPEITALTRRGREIPVSLSARVMRDTSGQAIGSVWVLHDITDLRKTEDESRRLTDGLAALNRLAVQLTAAPPDFDIYRCLAEQLKTITGAVAVGTSEYDPARRELRIRHLTAEAGMLARVNQLLGKNILSLRFPVTPEIYDRMVKETVGRAGDLSETTFGAVTRPVGNAIQKLLGIGNFIGLAFAYRGELLGTAVISSRTAAPAPHPDFLRAFAGTAAVALHRRQVEDALREAESARLASEARYRTLFDHSPIGIYRTTPDGRILIANPALVRMLGYASFDELARRNLETEGFEPGYARQQFKAELERQGEIRGKEVQWRQRDGSLRFVRENALLIRDSAGKTLYYEGTVEDIADRKRAEAKMLALRDRLEDQVRARTAELTLANRQLEAEIREHRRADERLRDSEARFHGAFQKATTGMCLTGPDGRFLDVNQSLCQMLQYTHAELTAIGFAAVTHPDDLPASQECVRSLLAGERETCRFEKRYLKKSGDAVWTEVSTVLLRTPDGAPLYFITHVSDITERRQAEDRVRQLNRELEASVARLKTANQELEASSCSVSDDLRAQLRSLDGSSRALLHDDRDRFDARGQDCLNRVRTATRRMAQLTDDLLTLSRVTRSELRMQSVNLTQLALSVIQEMQQTDPRPPAPSS